MKNDSNKEDNEVFGETAFSSVNIDSDLDQMKTIQSSDTANFQNNNENNIRLIKVNKTIQAVKYCSNSIRFIFVVYLIF